MLVESWPRTKKREVEVSKLNDAVRQCDIAAVRRQAAKKHVAAFAKTILSRSPLAHSRTRTRQQTGICSCPENLPKFTQQCDESCASFHLHLFLGCARPVWTAGPGTTLGLTSGAPSSATYNIICAKRGGSPHWQHLYR